MNILQMTHEDLLNHSNCILAVVITGLAKEGFIAADKVDDIQLNYSILVEDPSWMQRFLIKWLGMKPDGNLNYRLVRAIGRQKEPE